MKQIPVQLAERSYLIEIEQGQLDRCGLSIRKCAAATTAAVIADDTVADLYGQRVLQSLESAEYDAKLITFAAGEASKNLATVRKLYDPLFALGMDRASPVVALGGGVVGDTAGFVAATYLRGVPLIQIPTTLLAMVDSSVGGKVGVNHSAGKNMIGAFYQPRAVVVDPSCLQSLPSAQLRNGLAECVKHAVIRDRALFNSMANQADLLLDASSDIYSGMIAANCKIKADVVSEDERESRQRMILNFGHTIGHAAEAMGGYKQLSHGESVAIGMTLAGRLAARHVGFGEGDELEALLRRLGLPTTLPPFDIEDLLVLMKRDKKASAGTLRWVLPTRIGSVRIVDDVPEKLVREVMEAGKEG